jgi:hypothetical protein
MPIVTKLAMLTREANADAEEADTCAGNVVYIDWNIVEITDQTYLVIAPMSNIQMAKLFGIHVDDKDKEKERDDAADDCNRLSRHDGDDDADIDSEFMHNDLVDVGDGHDDELISVYDNENPVIEVGRLFRSMDEFRMYFWTYAIKHEIETKTLWTDKKKFYARCKGFDDGSMPCNWYISAICQPDGRTIRVNQILRAHTSSSQKVSTMTSQLWVEEKSLLF